MSDCLCSSLWQELSYKMKDFERKYRKHISCDDQTLKGQYELLKQQEGLASDLREIEVTQDVLRLCPRFAGKSHGRDEPRQTSPEYLIGPLRHQTIVDWVREELDGSSSVCDEEFRRTPSCLVDQSDVSTDVQSTGRWVLVYGFTPSLLPLIVAMFSQMGQSLVCEKSTTGNWAAFKYLHPRDVDKALKHHESFVSGQVIGVTDCEDFIQKVRSCRIHPPQESYEVPRQIRSLRQPRIETTTNCQAPGRLTGWRRAWYHVKELLDF